LGGISVLLLVTMYVVASVWVVSRCHKWAAVAVFLSLVSLPFLDAIAGRIYLTRKCATEGAISVTRIAKDVHGIRLNGLVSVQDAKKYGYNYIESAEDWRDGLVSRATAGPGHERVETNVRPQAQLELTSGTRQKGLVLDTVRISVREVSTGYELGGYSDFYFNGGWAERLVMMFTDAGPGIVDSCRFPHTRRRELLHRVAEPAK
jgi:hypothetical protein